MEIYRCMMRMSIIQYKNLLEHKDIVSIITAIFKLMVTNNILGLSFYKLVHFRKNNVNL